MGHRLTSFPHAGSIRRVVVIMRGSRQPGDPEVTTPSDGGAVPFEASTDQLSLTDCTTFEGVCGSFEKKCAAFGAKIIPDFEQGRPPNRDNFGVIFRP